VTSAEHLRGHARAPRGAAAAVVFGALVYLMFAAAFLYMIGFMGDVVVGRTVDGPVRPGPGTPLAAVAIDLALVALFGLQHSGMARTSFKAWLTRRVPQLLERSVYVLATNLVLALLFWQWRPLPQVVWEAGSPALRWPLWILFWSGWVLAAWASCAIAHFELFGLQQVRDFAAGVPGRVSSFRVQGPYRFVRHPILLGFLVSAWCVPRMTAGHVLFSLASSAYILLGVRLEERDLLSSNPGYAGYRRSVPGFVPLPFRAGGSQEP
jgi:methanethiol S-methyltransferase